MESRDLCLNSTYISLQFEARSLNVVTKVCGNVNRTGPYDQSDEVFIYFLHEIGYIFFSSPVIPLLKLVN